METTISIDLYGYVFVNGENTSRQIGDFARDPANYALAPQIDAAVTAAALAARTYIANQLAAKDARIAELEAQLAAGS